MLTLLIDNYDSYTFNLYQLLAQVNGEEPVVVRNDERPWAELAQWGFDNVLLSPGPGHPGRTRDFGVCADALAEATVPVLGVCLGHQGLAVAEGGVVDEADDPMHGRPSAIMHDGSALFAGIPQGFSAVRYHSLAVRRVPPTLRTTAWTATNVVMGIEDPHRPRYGVQFHPESIATEHGETLLRNFRDLTHRAGGRRRSARPAGTVVPHRTAASPRRQGVHAHARRIGAGPDPESAFVALLGEAPHAFWLDSALPAAGRARWSIMGAADDALIHRTGVDGDLLDRLSAELASRRCEPPPDSPVPFAGGLVGYLGYELKAECGAARTHTSPLPDAALLRADRALAFDHEDDAWHLVFAGERDAAERWFDETQAALARVAPAAALDTETDDHAGSDDQTAFTADRDATAYAAAVRECQERIRHGETYEICLTAELHSDAHVDPLTLHRVLRHTNPAPYAAFLRLGDTAIVSSSPERFLRVGRDGTIESRPIKGTAARAAGDDPAQDAARSAALAASEKDRAENLMIVDLVRNDLGLVCEVGSVEVPALMEVERYETVHQLVSTVRGHLRADVDVTDAIRACFPPGSMTGAPKLRTMEILDELEGRARGPYAGALGYLSLDGSADLSVVIRTAIVTADGVSIGAGGAVVAQSEPEAEHAEMLLKARAVVEAVATARAALDHRGAR